MYFNSTTNTPTAEQRHAAIVARILAVVAKGPKTPYEIRKAIEADPDFRSWAGANAIWQIVCALHRTKRLTRVMRQERSMPAYCLPEDPLVPFNKPRPTPEELAERERKILGSLNWPKWFYVPSKEDLLPVVRNYPSNAGRPIHL